MNDNNSIHSSKDVLRLLILILINYLYRTFISTPISFVKSYSRHPISITLIFLILFPIYLLLQLLISTFKFISNLSVIKQQEKLIHFMFGGNIDNDQITKSNRRWDMGNNNRRRHREEISNNNEEDDMQQWLERCSICFESKLDLCLDFCKDQFCLNCFQKYVTEVVKSSWGLSITKIRCPVCRVYVPQSEWTKFVPKSITELYNKFNKPFRSFYRCCPHCETEITPCCRIDNNRSNIQQSKNIAGMIKSFFSVVHLHVTVEQHLDKLLPNLTYQQNVFRIFDKSEWKNSTLPEIHHQLITKLIKSCQVINQMNQIKAISNEILQLEMKPSTWRKLQFDHISFFSNTSCPYCEKEFCLKCGHNNSHGDLTCEENMKLIIKQNEEDQTSNDLVQTLKWKLENSRNCPSCSIMINRDEGCNKVDCTLCGFSFCWECKNTWTEYGCGYFNCSINKSNNSKASDGNEANHIQLNEDLTLSADVDNFQTTELGVPNVNFIQSRLNSNNN